MSFLIVFKTIMRFFPLFFFNCREPDVKRSICKSCQCPLVPGETARVRLLSKPIKAVKYTCLLCKSSRILPTKKGYKLWTQEPESIVKIFDYTPKDEELKRDPILAVADDKKCDV